MTRVPNRSAILTLTCMLLAACARDQPGIPASSEALMTIQLSSPAFAHGATIPRKYTCDGSDVSPPLEWSGVPDRARSLALIVDDPDAPRGTWSHWVVFGLPTTTTSLPEGGPLPDGTQTGRNDFRKTGYGGPCPPPGAPHRYFFRLYALDRDLTLDAGATRQEVLDRIRDHILAQGELMGTYSR